MANRVPVSTALRMQLQTGIDQNGDPVFRTKTLSNVKTDAEDQDMLDVAVTLVGLQKNPMVTTIRNDLARLELE